jgi:hypothetical protein
VYQYKYKKRRYFGTRVDRNYHKNGIENGKTGDYRSKTARSLTNYLLRSMESWFSAISCLLYFITGEKKTFLPFGSDFPIFRACD